MNLFCFLTHFHFFGLYPLPPTHALQIRVTLGTPVVCSRALLRLDSSRAFVCEGPDNEVRRFWWRRLEWGNYDVSHSTSPFLPSRLTRPLCPSLLGLFFAVVGHFSCSYTPLMNLLLCASGYFASINHQSRTPSGISTQRSSSISCIHRYYLTRYSRYL